MASQQMSALELERQKRIEANKARLQQIGLLDTVREIATAQGERRRAAKAAKAATRAARQAARAEPSAARRVRRSERVAGLDAPNYNENARLLALADPTDTRDRRLMRENVSEEIYDVAHLDALGSYEKEWELFVDGYDANGNRIYDKVNGLTCHQCRQKTLGKRTSCSGCESLTGVLCGDCLFMRYGENVDEVNANPDWRCPHCRDLCNCSFHRSKRGWAPTGTLYRHAIAEGYLSCAHYLVLNNLCEEAKPVALERGLCPPELAAELKKEIAAAEKAAADKAAGQAAEEGEEAAAGAPAAAAAAAVQEQLLEPEGSQEGAGEGQEEDEAEAMATTPAPARRCGRGARGLAAAAAAEPDDSPAPAMKSPRGRRQATLQLEAAGGVRKQKAGSVAAAGKGGKGAAGKAAAGKGAAAGAGAAAAAGSKDKQAADKAAAGPERRGLRSSARVRATAA